MEPERLRKCSGFVIYSDLCLKYLAHLKGEGVFQRFGENLC